MRTEDAVRESLARAARLADPVPLSGLDLREAGAVRPRARRAHPPRRRTVALAAVVAALVALLVVPTVRSVRPLPPASGTVDRWPARGDLAHDPVLADRAKAAWDAAPVLQQELPHRDVRVLLATTTPYGRFVMLSGRNALGHRRLAVVGDGPPVPGPYASRLLVYSDLPFPGGPVLTYGIQRPRPRGGQDPLFVLVVAPPGTSRIEWKGDRRGEVWHDLPVSDGAAAAHVDPREPAYGVTLRAHRGGRVAEGYSRATTTDYVPDEDAAKGRRREAACHDAACAIAGTLTGHPEARESVLAGYFEQGGRDMSWYATRLWRNRALAGGELYGRHGSVVDNETGRVGAVLRDGTGVYLYDTELRDGPRRYVLYVDRPEWLTGRLFLDHAVPGPVPVAVVSAVVPAAAGAQLVVFAADGVQVAYRLDGGAWQPVTVKDRVGTVPLRRGEEPSRIELRVTAGGVARLQRPDAVAPLPPA
jgi:hypothetical protein